MFNCFLDGLMVRKKKTYSLNGDLPQWKIKDFFLLEPHLTDCFGTAAPHKTIPPQKRRKLLSQVHLTVQR